jgi:hypothetical protein
MSSLAARRKQRYRQRLRRNTIVLPVEAGCALVATLVEAGFVAETEVFDRGKLAGAVTAVLDRWVRHWRDHGR